MALMSTLPTWTWKQSPTDIDSLTASFSPLWLPRLTPPYCGASHTNDRKATGFLPAAASVAFTSLWRHFSANRRAAPGGSLHILSPHFYQLTAISRGNLGRSYNFQLEGCASATTAAEAAQEKATSSLRRIAQSWLYCQSGSQSRDASFNFPRTEALHMGRISYDTNLLPSLSCHQKV